jgi:hypothetical protein
MSELLQILSTGSPVAVLITTALLILSVTVSTIYIVAFAQGRSISFWPPSIGERPKDSASRPEDEGPKRPPAGPNDRVDTRSPVVDRGTILRGASGKSYRVLSAYYGGATATLYKVEEDAAGLPVVAKVYWRGLAPHSPPWEMFNQEQRTAELLSHRNIVKTLDRGLSVGYPFTIMEYLAGGTLRD